MDKIITLRTAELEIATSLQEQITAILDENVNCTWFDEAWEVSTFGEASEIEDIAAQIRQCENYADGLISIKIENED